MPLEPITYDTSNLWTRIKLPILFPGWSSSEPLPQPRYLERVLTQNREKSFGRTLHAPISAIWRSHLRPQPLPTEPSRHNSYILIPYALVDVNVCMGSQYLSVTHIYTDTQSHKCAQMAEFSGEYGNTWVFGALVLRYPWIFGHHTHPPRGLWLAYPLRCRGY
jgi:hypothetical protein